ncbi:DUF4166 domain-containing protein [Scleromatobacter humisilvae]|uniref:DUF4166 domain-containing protein n=1 Tax=Scleromatobacter humisilvae TaxID=2897159 RepID=A0A9X2BZT8_9BURK|nr:DUF4166 domain-containing protein [Scleromatobacter humisilvae]MCK9687048.1 DUF4166 domain-containing protein [Scleromatobacter humisilvae]
MSRRPSLFEAALGARFEALAPALGRFHRLSGHHELHGAVETDPPDSPIGRLLARCLGSPRQAASGAIRFELDAAPDVETWTRHFPFRTMRSRMRLVDGQVVECMGPARLVFALEEVDGGLRLRLRSLRFLGIPCPAWLRPRLEAGETGDGDRLCFRIEAAVPGIGRVVGYRGHLVVPDETAA